MHVDIEGYYNIQILSSVRSKPTFNLVMNFIHMKQGKYNRNNFKLKQTLN